MVAASMNSYNIEQLKSVYERNGQGHVFKFYEQLSEAEKQTFISQLEEIPIESLNGFFLNATKDKSSNGKPGIAPLSQTEIVMIGRSSEDEERWWNIGMDAIKGGRLAVVTLAGGQGTRLGSSLPKGCFDIGLLSHKSLFQLQAERLRRLGNLSGTPISWYIMTSGPTHEESVKFFKTNAYFGLDRARIKFFQQGVLPALSMEGKILLQSKGSLALSPDGNGGIYAALKSSGIIEELEANGVEYVHMHAVDNCLVKVADPVFLGICRERGIDCASKSIAKNNPKESVGILCRREVDGKMIVAEYSELDPKLAESLNSNGKLVFDAANIAIHMFSTEFLRKICYSTSANLPYHVAKKKIPSIDIETGDPIATPPIGIKLEAFIFDVLEHALNPVVVQIQREAEFAPLKNATGSAPEDTPEFCRDRLYNLHRKLLIKAGANVVGDGACEISPLVSYAGEGLEEFSGAAISLPAYIESRPHAKL